MFVDVVLPLALPKPTYTYAVPDGLAEMVQSGVRVEVQFGKNKIYSGIVVRAHFEQPAYNTKPILSVLDSVIVVTQEQLALWQWLSSYYCCTLGEVMLAALPAHLKLNSETMLVFNPAYGEDFSDLDSDGYLLAEALLLQESFSLDTVRKILNKKTVFPTVQQLLTKGVLFLREDLQDKFKARKQVAVRLAAPYQTDQVALRNVFEQVDKLERQLELLMSYMHLSKQTPSVLKSALLQKADVSDSTLRTMVKKGVFELYDLEVSRIAGYEDDLLEAGGLSDAQTTAYQAINAQFDDKQVVLLHGVTGSGKTRVYIELMRDVIKKGGQVLYLLPEIGLTTQLISRLQKVMGDDISVYHSKIGYNERVELWRSAFLGKSVLMGARSALFLPFKKLDLIIVDEEHDPSFKQNDPAPRYHARDTAVYLAGLYQAKVLLGTATPSLESYYNVQQGKYGLVNLTERFGGLAMPEIQPIDLKVQQKTKQMEGVFSKPLLDALKQSIEQGEQVILFQNRRGYAPIMECQVCGWNATCKDCDVSLTYHKFSNSLRCHYCGYRIEPQVVCPACGSGKIGMLGFGTEKIEDDLKVFLPTVRIGRLDMDTASTKNNLTTILTDFEEKRLDILVGTQMVTKGLDFDNVGLVGVIGADQLVRFPDFRAGERAYQLLTQVAGRSGRHRKKGLVMVQAYNPGHPVIKEVAANDFEGFMARELRERADFFYPPYSRLISLRVRHKDERVAAASADYLGKILRVKLGKRVLGPVVPQIARIRTYYYQDILLKLEKSAQLIQDTKMMIQYNTTLMQGVSGFSQVQVIVDVDPA
jgi:primosomal protein N' (replication factor Y)